MLKQSSKQIEKIAPLLAANLADEAIDELLPAVGRIHIDRRRPFLCLYRDTEDDAGTGELLTGLAAFIIAETGASHKSLFRTLLTQILRQGADAFGKILLFEIWSRSTCKDNEALTTSGATKSTIHIYAPSHDSPCRTLDIFQRALLEQDWPEGSPEISISYGKEKHPKGIPPLISDSLRKELDATMIGVELSPFYRNPETGKVFPEIINKARHALSMAIKQAVYEFSHARATYRPAHYHQLGSTVISDQAWKVDKGLAKIGDSFDLLLHVTPVNSEAAFYSFKRSHYNVNPQFAYRPLPVEPSALKAGLYKVQVKNVDDPALHSIFTEKQDELDRQITLLSDRGTPRFLLGSQQIYGKPEKALVEISKEILSQIPPHTHDDNIGDYIDAKAFATAAKKEIANYQKTNPKFTASVEIRDDVPGLMVSKNRFLIGQNATVARSRIKATIHHEIGTHILTYLNGKEQPFQLMHTGFAGYEELQEGMAVFSEYLSGGLTRPRIRTLAGRVLAANMIIGGAEFVEAYRKLHDAYCFSNKNAFTIAMRVYRGGGYVKDIIYLRGLMSLLKSIAEGADLKEMLSGKFALHHRDLTDELIWRGILKPPVHIPRYFEDPKAMERFQLTRKGLSVLDLLKGDGS